MMLLYPLYVVPVEHFITMNQRNPSVYSSFHLSHNMLYNVLCKVGANSDTTWHDPAMHSVPGGTRMKLAKGLVHA